MLSFYHDDPLSEEVTADNPINPSMDTLGVTIPYVDKEIKLGTPDETKRYRAASDPGVDQIMVAVRDDSVGSGLAATSIKLALTQGGLAAAVAGESLAVGTQILGGVDNAVTVWVRYLNVSAAVNNYLDVYPETDDVIEDVI
jgi:hypothetical protein